MHKATSNSVLEKQGHSKEVTRDGVAWSFLALVLNCHVRIWVKKMLPPIHRPSKKKIFCYILSLLAK